MVYSLHSHMAIKERSASLRHPVWHEPCSQTHPKKMNPKRPRQISSQHSVQGTRGRQRRHPPPPRWPWNYPRPHRYPWMPIPPPHLWMQAPQRHPYPRMHMQPPFHPHLIHPPWRMPQQPMLFMESLEPLDWTSMLHQQQRLRQQHMQRQQQRHRQPQQRPTDALEVPQQTPTLMTTTEPPLETTARETGKSRSPKSTEEAASPVEVSTSTTLTTPTQDSAVLEAQKESELQQQPPSPRAELK